MKVKTTRFGEIEIAQEDLVIFPEGLPGFEDLHEFVLLPYEEKSPYVFLQSASEDYIAFLMTNPFLFVKEYEFNLSKEIMEELAIKSQEDFAVYAMITVPEGGVRQMTANLAAPVVINSKNRQARQIVLEKNGYHTKHLLFSALQTDKEAK